MALSVEAPVVTTSSRMATGEPGASAFMPSIHWPVPWPLGSLRTMKACSGVPDR